MALSRTLHWLLRLNLQQRIKAHVRLTCLPRNQSKKLFFCMVSVTLNLTNLVKAAPLIGKYGAVPLIHTTNIPAKKWLHTLGFKQANHKKGIYSGDDLRHALVCEGLNPICPTSACT